MIPKFGLSEDPSATDGTRRKYLRGGLKLLDRATKLQPLAIDAVEAFRALFADPSGVYRPVTTRIYQQQVKAVFAWQLHQGVITRDRAQEGFAIIAALLKERRGRPPARTSRKKLKDPTLAEYNAIRADFSARKESADGLDPLDHALALLVNVTPYLGLRPGEWRFAAMEDGVLWVKNAKATNGRAPGEVRDINLTNVPHSIVAVIGDLIALFHRLFDEEEEGWRRALGVLGERLARVCKRLKIRRWSLYTPRHIAIASWKKAGLSPREIAGLAGHISLNTASKHYAGSRFGWTAKFAGARPGPSVMAIIEARKAAMPVAQSNPDEEPAVFAMR
jgi:hypothetical protein